MENPIYPYYIRDGKKNIVWIIDWPAEGATQLAEDEGINAMGKNAYFIFPNSENQYYYFPKNFLENDEIKGEQLFFLVDIAKAESQGVDIYTTKTIKFTDDTIEAPVSYQFIDVNNLPSDNATSEKLWNLAADIRYFRSDCFKDTSGLNKFIYHNYRESIITLDEESFSDNSDLQIFDLNVPNGQIALKEKAFSQNHNIEQIKIRAREIKCETDDKNILKCPSTNLLTLISTATDLQTFKMDIKQIGLLETNQYYGIHNSLKKAGKKIYFNSILFYPNINYNKIILDETIKANNNGETPVINLDFRNVIGKNGFQLNITDKFLIQDKFIAQIVMQKIADFYSINYENTNNELNSFLFTYYLQSGEYCRVDYIYDSDEDYGGTQANLRSKGGNLEIFSESVINPYVFCGYEFSSIKVNEGAVLKDYCFAFNLNCTKIDIADNVKVNQGVFDNCLGVNDLTCGAMDNGYTYSNIFCNLGNGNCDLQIQPNIGSSILVPIVQSWNRELNITFTEKVKAISSNFITDYRKELIGNTGYPNYQDLYLIFNFETQKKVILNTEQCSEFTTIDENAFNDVYKVAFSSFPEDLREINYQFIKKDQDYKYDNYNNILQSNNNFIWKENFGVDSNKYWIIKCFNYSSLKDDNCIGIATHAAENQSFSIPDKITFGKNLQAIGAYAFNNATFKSNTSDNSILNFSSTKKLKYIGPNALSLNTKSNEISSYTFKLPVDKLKTIYNTSFPYELPSGDEHIDNYIIDLYQDSTNSQSELYQWLTTIERIDFLPENSKEIQVPWKLQINEKDVSSIALGFESIEDIKNSSLEAEFLPSEDETIHCINIESETEKIKIQKYALRGNSGITTYYLNLDKCDLTQAHIIDLWAAEKAQSISDNNSSRVLNLICVGGIGNVSSNCINTHHWNDTWVDVLNFDRLRIPAIAITNNCCWLTTTAAIENKYNANKIYLYSDQSPSFTTNGIVSTLFWSDNEEEDKYLKLDDFFNVKETNKSEALIESLPIFNKEMAQPRFKNIKTMVLSFLNEKNTIIPSRFLYNWDWLKDIKLEGNYCGEIRKEAFYNVSALSSMHFTNSLTDIGENAFVGCSNLSEVQYDGSPQDWYKINFNNEGANPFYSYKNDDNTSSPKYKFKMESELKEWYNNEFIVPLKNKQKEPYDPYPFYKYPIKRLIFLNTNLTSPIVEETSSEEGKSWPTKGIEEIVFDKLPIPENSEFPNFFNTLFKNNTNLSAYPNLKSIYITNNTTILNSGLLRDLNTANISESVSRGPKNIEIVLPQNIQVLERNCLSECHIPIHEWSGNLEENLDNISGKSSCSFSQLKYSDFCGLTYDITNNSSNIVQYKFETEDENKTHKKYYFFNNGYWNFLLYIDEVEEGEDGTDNDVFEYLEVINQHCVNNIKDLNIKNKRYIKTLYLPWLGSCRDPNYIPEDLNSYTLKNYMRHTDEPTYIDNITIGNENISYYYDRVIEGKCSKNRTFEGIIIGDEITGELNINYQEILGTIANRNHFDNVHSTIDNCKKFNINVGGMTTLPSHFLTRDETGNDATYWRNHIKDLALSKIQKIEKYSIATELIDNIYINKSLTNIDTLAFSGVSIKNNVPLKSDYIYFNDTLEQWVSNITFENKLSNPVQYALGLKTISSAAAQETAEDTTVNTSIKSQIYEIKRELQPTYFENEEENKNYIFKFIMKNNCLHKNRQIDSINLYTSISNYLPNKGVDFDFSKINVLIVDDKNDNVSTTNFGDLSLGLIEVYSGTNGLGGSELEANKMRGNNQKETTRVEYNSESTEEEEII